MDPLIGQVLGDRFRVVRLLGVGGMGRVYEVEHTQLPKRFAIKVLGSKLASEDEALRRFRREAEIVAGLQHPHIVEIVDWATMPDGRPFYVMELLEGIDLGARIKTGPLSWPEIRMLAEQSFSALQEAHRQGVLHRDLKPHNIFLRDVDSSLHVKLIDFGLARARDMAAIKIYTSPKLIGTPAYMSPEQILGKGPVSEDADTWAMAAVLYAAAAGKAPFRGSFGVLVEQIGKRRPVPLRVLRPDAPAAFADALAAALSPDPQLRVRSLGELRERIARALGGELPSAPPQDLPASRDSVPESVSSSQMATKRERSPEAPVAERVNSPSRAKWILLGAAPVIGFLLFFLVHGEEPSSAPAASPPSDAKTVGETLLPQPAPEPPPAPEEEAQEVEVRVETEPSGARLFVDLVFVGVDGLRLRRAADTELRVSCHQAGYDGGEVKIIFDGEREDYVCKLKRKGRKRSRKEATKKPSKKPSKKLGDDVNVMIPDF